MLSLSLILTNMALCFFSPHGKMKNKKEDIALKKSLQYMNVMKYYL